VIHGLLLGLGALLLKRPVMNVAIVGLGVSMLLSMIASILILNNNLKLIGALLRL
jgi:hypothetical protein